MSFLSSIGFAVQRLRGRWGRTCTPVDQIRDWAPNSEGCERCIDTGDTWVYLRARFKEPGVDWLWCYVDEALVRAEVS